MQDLKSINLMVEIDFELSRVRVIEIKCTVNI